MPNIRTRRRLIGASAAAIPAPVVAQVFHIDLWTGNGVSQNIVNGIDLAGQGGAVWTKNRNSTETPKVFNSQNGNGYWRTDATSAAAAFADSINSYNSDGYSLGAGTGINTNANTYVGWCLRNCPRFFQQLNYTGDGQTLRGIGHNIGITPGVVIVKRRDAAGSAAVYHIQSNPGHQYNLLNDSALPTVSDNTFGGVAADATTVWLGNNAIVNAAGGTYSMYIFAHDTANDGIIYCDKFTGNGLAAGPTVTIGWQPQYVGLIRRITTSTGNWSIFDTVRGAPSGAGDLQLVPNNSAAEVSTTAIDITSTGFTITSSSSTFNASGDTYIYMAIRS